MSRHTDPAGSRFGPAGGSAYPASMKLKCIRDAQIVALLAEEKRLREALNDSKVDQRKAADAKDANLREFQPAADSFMSNVFSEIDKAQAERSALMESLDELRNIQRSLGQKRDRLKLLDFELDDQQYRKDLAALSRKVEDETKRVEKLSSSSSPSPTNQLAALKGTLEQRMSEKQSKEAERKTLREQLAKSGEIAQQFTQARKQLDAVSERLDKLFAKKKAQKPQNKELDGINKQLVEARSRRDALGEQLDAVQKQLQFTRFSFAPAYRGDLVGKQGATLAQLQEDFGVAINIDTAAGGDKGLALLIGGPEDVAACVDAMQSIVDNAERTRQQFVMKFDPALSKVLIGGKGANIDRMQLTSGANIKIKDDEITLTGTAEAIEAAKTQIQEIISNSARVEIPFDRNILEIVIGKGGATVRKVEQESGAKAVKVLRNESMIVISGNDASVQKAAAMYRELIENMSHNASTIRADTQMIRAVIGAGGKTIREIQDSTGALITCGKDVISIRGSKDAVALARKQIEDVGRREEVKVAFPNTMYGYLTTPTTVPEEQQQQEDSSARTTATTAPAAAAAAAAPSAKEDGNNNALTPIDAIKKVSKCDQVVALQREGVVVIRGRREHVLQAKQLLDDILRTKRPMTATVPIPDVLFSFFTKRGGGGKGNVLTQLKAKHPRILSFDLDRASSTIIVAAPQTPNDDQSDIQSAVAAVKDILAGVEGHMRKVDIPAGRAGAVIGSGGKVIGGIQSRTQTDITVHKEQNVVWVFHETGNEASLDEAVAAVKEAAGCAGTTAE